MKKIIAVILTLILSVSVLSGCQSDTKTSVNTDGPGNDISLTEEQKNSDTLLSNDEISYVMIYNPNIYDEYKSYNELLNTGDFAPYVEAVVNRADGIEAPIPEFLPSSVAQNNSDVDLGGINLDGDRAGSFITPYEVGDTHDFYCGADSRTLKTFRCMYAGEYCNVWGCDSSITSSDANEFGEEFDNNIYNQVINMFGNSRFADNGGKVNLLFYPMGQNLGGFFYIYDLLATGEFHPSEQSRYGINADHDIVNINSEMIRYNKEFAFSTMAHEFQHLICFTGFFYTMEGTCMRTWLNEAMSGYIEAYLYPNSKEDAGHYDAFVTSNRIRHGQSMYNFDTTMPTANNSELDIGVYGSVYLFSEYLATVGGSDVFSNIHAYWRDSYSSTLDEAEAIAESVSPALYDRIDGILDYGTDILFDDKNDEWMSKLVLDFYLSLLKPDSNTPEAYEKIEAQTLLYDEINPAEIEGGGRVIVALKDGEFKFPDDADDGLVYVGLNSNFEIVTPYVIR